MKKPTIKDVAREAGVAWSTVGNVIRGDVPVAPATRERVEAAIRSTGYRPQLAGRHLRRGRADLIALAIPRIDLPYFARLAHALIGHAEQHGYRVFIDETHDDPDRELEASAGFPGRGVDAVVLSAAAVDDARFEATERDVPLVLLGDRVESTTVHHVGIDNRQAAADAVDHLVAHGRRRVGYVGPAVDGDRPTATSNQRREGLTNALARHGLEPPVLLRVPTSGTNRERGELSAPWAWADGRDVVLAHPELLRGLDAVVCAGDLLAVGVLRGLQEIGLSVPGDVAVVGWDDLGESAYSNPPLTSVAVDVEGIARTAIEVLVEELRNPGDRPPRTHLVPHGLTLRESTQPR